MSVISKFYHALHIHTEVQEQSDSYEIDAAGREQLSMPTPIIPHRRLYLFLEYFDNYPDCIWTYNHLIRQWIYKRFLSE